MSKSTQLSNQLRTRILHGDYSLRTMPAERQLATEHGVSYMTARRAVQELINDGLLVRGSNGRVEVNKCPASGPGHPTVALISPAFDSPGFDHWRHQLSQAVEGMGQRIQHVLFKHWDDPVIAEALRTYDGVFLLPSSETIPANLISQLVAAPSRVVVLDDDLTSYGLPCIMPLPPQFVNDLLEHLRQGGFTHVDCLNTQPVHSVVCERIAVWQQWKERHNLTGELINEPVEPYTLPYRRAYEVMKERCFAGQVRGQAIFCVTDPAAVGAMRALHECGLRPGYEVAVCSVADAVNTAEFQIPSLTTLEPGEVGEFISQSLAWMAGSKSAWQGPLLMQPRQSRVMPRESTRLHLREPVPAM